MKGTPVIRIVVAALTFAASVGGSLRAQSSAAPAANPKPTIVLVHGAFADATGWQRVIPILQRDGYEVIAVQIPLSSLDTDIETAKRVLDAQKGPIVLVGHSYGPG
jgi:pimeloyl-ACP methyl ester carboxylesterase